MREKKRGRGRPKGSPNKPVMELITERVNLTKNADVYEILCQADIVAQEDVDKGKWFKSIRRVKRCSATSVSMVL